MKLEKVKISSLTLDPENARKHSKKNLDAIAGSLNTFGQRRPLVVWDNIVIAGNGTIEAAKSLGWTDIEITRCPPDWTHDQARAYALADNRTAELAEWDADILANQLIELDAVGYDVSEWGFEKLEPPTDPEQYDDIDINPPTTAVTKPGDLWILGQHRVICGDSTTPATYRELLNGELADCIFTDPPYNVAYEGGTKDRLTIENDNMSDAQFESFIQSAFNAMYEHIKPGGAIYVCHSDTGGVTFRQTFMNAGFLLKQCLIWVKNSIVLSRKDYNWQHEPILYGWKPGAAHEWHGLYNKSTVLDDEQDILKMKKEELVALLLDIRKQTTITRIDIPRRNGDHPTMKPASLIARITQNSTQQDELILDPFGGSGSTLLAAEATHRRAALIELDPIYVDVICRRYQEATGNQPINHNTGQAHNFTPDP